MSKIAAMKDSVDAALRDKDKFWTNYLALAEAKTGINRLYIFLGSVVTLAIYLVLGVRQRLLCNIIGFLYPAYRSMKAIESPSKEDDRKWLIYWSVYAIFTIIEDFSDLIFFWFPLYWLLKCILYIWLMVPTEYNGSLILYNRLIRPKFLQYQPEIDKIIASTKETAVKAAVDNLLTEKED